MVGVNINILKRSCGSPHEVLATVLRTHHCGCGVDKETVRKAQRFDQVRANDAGLNGNHGQSGIPLSELRRVQNLCELSLAAVLLASSKAVFLLGLDVVKDNASISWH